MSLTSIAAPIWNEIAKTQTLETSWPRRVFAMDQDAIAAEEHLEYKALKRLVGQDVAIAYLDMKPLDLERKAIARFTQANPNYLQALPEIASTSEAVLIASADRPLTRQ